MTKDDLVKFRLAFQLTMVQELSLRNALLIEALRRGLAGENQVFASAHREVETMLEQIAKDTEILMLASQSQEASKQMYADECREILEGMKKHASLLLSVSGRS